MINRVLIRIRAVQILFAYYQNGDNDSKKAENELLFSLQKSYDLYFYLLELMIVITDLHSQRVKSRKSKLLPSKEDMHPNTKLIDNKFVALLKTNEQFLTYLKERPFDWYEHEAFVRNVLEAILSSKIYEEYSEIEIISFDEDCDFWRKVFKQIIYTNEELYTILEDESLYWNDDIEIVISFVLKTIKKFDETKGSEQKLLPMFKDEADREFAVKLLHQAIWNGKEYRELIDKHTANWESERIAAMDMIVMQLALTEFIAFPSIPISVTLNEYIDIAKSYSSAKSSSFINGVLDTIVKMLQEEKRIIKK